MKYIRWIVLCGCCYFVSLPVVQKNPVLYLFYVLLLSCFLFDLLVLEVPYFRRRFWSENPESRDYFLLLCGALLILIFFIPLLLSFLVSASYFNALLLNFENRMLRHPWWALCLVIVIVPIEGYLFQYLRISLRNKQNAVQYRSKREHGSFEKTVESADELSRNQTVNALYECLISSLNNKGDEISCVGLFGVWGEGKTFVLKMLRDEILITRKCRELEFVEFNPWNCIDRKMQPAELFRSISEVLKKRSGRDISELSQRYANSISQLECRKFLAAVPNIGTLLSLAWDFVFRSKNVAEKLNDELNRLDYHLVVVIDNVDRLPPDDICDLIRLICTHGRLCKVIYLIAADKDYMARAIQKMVGFNKDDDEEGHWYLEKIFTKRVYLPKTPWGRLVEIFQARVTSFIAKHQELGRPSKYKPEIPEIVSGHLKTMRDVIKLSDAVEIEYQILKERWADSIVPNIDLGDFLALTVMKYDEEEFYLLLYRGMTTKIFKSYDSFSGMSKQYSEKELKDIFAPTASELKWSDYKMFLEEYLGINQKKQEGYYEYAVKQEKATATFRLQSVGWFDYYFTGLRVGDQVITKQSVQDLLERLKNQSGLLEEQNNMRMFEINIKRLKTCALQKEILEETCFKAYVQNICLYTEFLLTQIDLGQPDSHGILNGYDVLFASVCQVMHVRPVDKQSTFSSSLLAVFKLTSAIHLFARCLRLESQNHPYGETIPEAWFTEADYKEVCKWYFSVINCYLLNGADKLIWGRALLMAEWRYICLHTNILSQDEQKTAKVTLNEVSQKGYPDVMMVVYCFCSDTLIPLKDVDRDVRGIDYDLMEKTIGENSIEKIVTAIHEKEEEVRSSDFTHFVYYKMLDWARKEWKNEEVSSRLLIDYVRKNYKTWYSSQK